MPDGISIVVPTIGRPSLTALLNRLAAQVSASDPVELLLIFDVYAPIALPPQLEPITRVLRGRGAGPAAARNIGWRTARFPWVSFVDDDVLPDLNWLSLLQQDLLVERRIGGVQGRVFVPLPENRAPTDWERNTHALSDAAWITADMAYRREALAAVGGFDERFPRAFREDADLAYRIRAAGWRLTVGQRRVSHPVRPEGPWVSLRMQRGNADDVLLRHKFGPSWRRKLQIPPGRRPLHLATTAAGLAALTLALTPAPAARKAAALLALSWLAATAEFAYRRITPGPRTAREIATMTATSILIPPLASYHWLAAFLKPTPLPPPSPHSP